MSFMACPGGRGTGWIKIHPKMPPASQDLTGSHRLLSHNCSELSLGDGMETRPCAKIACHKSCHSRRGFKKHQFWTLRLRWPSQCEVKDLNIEFQSLSVQIHFRFGDLSLAFENVNLQMPAIPTINTNTGFTMNNNLAGITVV